MTNNRVIQLALQHGREGRFQEAENIYRQILSQQPAHIDALFLLGDLLAKTGHADKALVPILRAIEINPDFADAHCTLGNIFLGKGRFDDAIAAYRKAIRLNPASAEAHNSIAFALNRRGLLDEAVTASFRTVELRPDSAEALNNLGNALKDLGRLSEAIAAYNRAIELKQDYAEAYSNLAAALTDSGWLEEGMVACTQAIRLKPTYAEAHLNLGNVFKEMMRFDDAITAYNRAIQFKPAYAQAYNNMGSALRKKGLLDEAITAYNRAIQLKSDHAAAYSNLGIALRDKGQFKSAMAAYFKAVELDPNNIEARCNSAILSLLLGDFKQGWAEFEWRFKLKNSVLPRSFLQSRWDGSQLHGKAILLHNEQGLGDTIQFVRYVPLVAARGGRVILVCQSSLVRLLSKLSNVERVVAVEDTLPSFEAHCPLMSLPNAFDTDLNSIPASAPYIKADPVLVQDWAVRLDSNRGRMKIGLAWAGSSTHLNDRNRSISLAKLFPITNVENAVFFSLQKGEAAEQISRSGASVVDFTSDLKDFADTAAFIANLDLIVSVDTAVAHLAGAMGKQVWVLLPFIPDWRWLLDREDSPWYPTMRLFRQKRAGDWEEPIQRIVNELTTLLKQS